MFARTLFTVLMLALSASQWPTIAEKVQVMLDERETAGPQEVAAKPVAATPSGQTVLTMAPNGHYTGTFRINGKPIEAMVDTGASLVAINVSTARRLGFSPAALDFQHQVRTANGSTKAAHVVLDRIEIGSIRVRNVDAVVLGDEALSSTLVGMSFMQKLKSYTAEKRILRMIQ
ncbi:aspartyl protease family protein [Rhizobium rosettiformans]|uniref:TIGR02281 family clan AA aspartic protease n=2 Tax=Rhizobium rosettiformans TaxID=1368430 RepID=A0A4S8PY72_9HYPH|nr:TIGR02281 family clan AA aspartic protease [Rhizobium rosettiformans]MBB5276015.1 aspartyl protease family protein [Rhizobium rosettiformans]THV36667.1 TIGR02281 family clan AA aspartic protease [Rhizobium rosettiformans W3]